MTFLQAVLFGVMIFGIMTLIFLIYQRSDPSQAVLSRLDPRRGDDAPSGGGTGGAVALARDSVRYRRSPLVERILKSLPEAPEWFRRDYQPRLVRAGYHRREHVNAFAALMVASVIGFTLIGWLGVAYLGLGGVYWKLPLSLSQEGVPVRLSTVVAFLGFLAGLAFPVMAVRRRVADRQQQLRDTLPDALDLMSVCLEAGIGVEGGMQRVGQELLRRNQPLGEELVLTSLQIEAGRPRQDALRAFALRTDIQEVKNLVTVLSQSERLGTGVSAALRTASDAMRTRRLQKAEASAAQTSVRSIFPLLLFMFATFVVLFGPALLQLLDSFAEMQGG